MKRKLFFLLIGILLTLMSVAAPVRNMSVCRIQPSGDTLHCFVSGDEYFHRLHDASGYTIVQDVKTGWYVYADVDEGVLVPTRWVPGEDDPSHTELVPNLMPSKTELRRLRQLWDVPEQHRVAAAKTSGANHGTLNNVVIFIRFSNETSCTTAPFSTVNAMFNDSAAGAVSMYNYFKKTSYGKMGVPTHFFPAPTGNTVISYQDSYPRSYYEPYSASNTSGYADDDERRSREFTLLQNAVTWVNNNSPVPASLNLDFDNDGYVDNICFVVSGTYTGWSDLLWPHKWSLYDRTVMLNGKRVYTFNLQLAGSGDHYFSVSTFCHEMTHTLGCPDIYHYEEYSNVSAGGSWDLMEQNQTPPQQTNSLFKLYYLNWMDSIPTLTDSGVYTMSSLASGSNHAYKIASANPHQWYILEYRNESDTFDSSIPGRGMLIWRFNDVNAADNAGFDFFDTPHQLWLFRPGSSVDTVNGNVAAAAFGVNGRTSFTSVSDPHPYLCNGTLDTTFSLTNIHLTNGNNAVEFTFTPHGGSGCPTMTSFPLTEEFEDQSTGCWTYTSMDPANDDRTGVLASTSSYGAHGGNYHFRFSSYDRASDYNQYLISPRLQPSNPLRMKFYYRKYSSGTECFKVKYSTTGNATSNFTNTLTDVTVRTTGWHSCEVLVPQSARYVAIDYYANYQYYLYIDDIELCDTLQSHDTTFVVIHDTITTWVHDTVERHIVDTMWCHAIDTMYYAVYDTVESVVYDTIPQSLEYASLTVIPFDTLCGRTSGSGRFPKGSLVELAAIAVEGFSFDGWSDGNSENPRTVNIVSDTSFVAFFERNDMAKASFPPIPLHDTIVTHDTVWVSLHDTLWVDIHDTLSMWVTDTLLLPNPIHDTLTMPIVVPVIWDTTTYFDLTVLPANLSMGLTAGSGRFPMGTVVQIAALPYEGYRFSHWSDGETANFRTVMLVESTTLAATFVEDSPQPPTPEAIDVTPNLPGAIVYAEDSRIVVSQTQNKPVIVYDAIGRQVCNMVPKNGESVATQPLPMGLYVVRVGSSRPHKIVISK